MVVMSGGTDSRYTIDRDGRLKLTHDNGTTVLTGPQLKLGTKYLIADVWDSSTLTLRMFVNGELVAEAINHPDTLGEVSFFYLGSVAATGLVQAAVGDAFSLDYPMTVAEMELLYRAWTSGVGYKTGALAGLALDAVGIPHTLPEVGRVSTAGIPDDSFAVPSILEDMERTELGRLFYESYSEVYTLLR